MGRPSGERGRPRRAPFRRGARRGRAGRRRERATRDRPARAVSLLREHNFRKFWLGQTISLFGDQITYIALPLAAVLVLDASAAEMGYLGAAALLPHLLFSLPAGVWLERVARRRHVMILCRPWHGPAARREPPARLCVRLADVRAALRRRVRDGTLAVLFDISYITLYVAVVERERYIEANSLMHGSRSFSYIAGPERGGLPRAAAERARSPARGRGLVRRRRRSSSAAWTAPGASARAAATTRVRDEIVEGLSFIFRNSILRPALLGTATLNFFNFAFWALFLLYATNELGIRAGTLGLVLGAGAFGGLIGAVVAGRIGRRIGIGPAYPPRHGALSGSAPPHPGSRRAKADRARDALRRRVPLGAGRHDPRHQRERLHDRPDAGPAPRRARRALSASSTRGQAPRRAARRGAWLGDGPAAGSLALLGRRARRGSSGFSLRRSRACATSPRRQRERRSLARRARARRSAPSPSAPSTASIVDTARRSRRRRARPAAPRSSRSTRIPRRVLGYDVELITPLERRIELIGEIGPDDLLVLEFTPELSRLEPEEFVGEVLEPLGTRIVVAAEASVREGRRGRRRASATPRSRRAARRAGRRRLVDQDPRAPASGRRGGGGRACSGGPPRSKAWS